MEETFLDISTPTFKEDEARLLSSGYIEKKYTRTTQKEIEDAFKRYLLKQEIPRRGLTTPAQINALGKELDALAATTLYNEGTTGAKFLKFKMYVPSEKLKKERLAAVMEENESNVFNESFAPNNYSEMVGVAEKAEKALAGVLEATKGLNVRSTQNNIQKVIAKTKKAEELVSNTLSKVKNANIGRRLQQTLKQARNMREYAEGIKKQQDKPYNDLATQMEKMIVTNYKTLGKSGVLINEAFIESILPIKNVNVNLNNENALNRDKLAAKALAAGLTTSDIKYIRDSINFFIAQGLDKPTAVKLGVILANMPSDKFSSLKKYTIGLRGKISNADLARQFAQYLHSKSGGKRSTKKRQTRKRQTRKRN